MIDCRPLAEGRTEVFVRVKWSTLKKEQQIFTPRTFPSVCTCLASPWRRGARFPDDVPMSVGEIRSLIGKVRPAGPGGRGHSSSR